MSAIHETINGACAYLVSSRECSSVLFQRIIPQSTFPVPVDLVVSIAKSSFLSEHAPRPSPSSIKSWHSHRQMRPASQKIMQLIHILNLASTFAATVIVTTASPIIDKRVCAGLPPKCSPGFAAVCEPNFWSCEELPLGCNFAPPSCPAGCRLSCPGIVWDCTCIFT